VSISARRRFRASATCTVRSASPVSSRRRVRASSSLSAPSSVLIPGVSMMSQTSAPPGCGRASPPRRARVVRHPSRSGPSTTRRVRSSRRWMPHQSDAQGMRPEAQQRRLRRRVRQDLGAGHRQVGAARVRTASYSTCFRSGLVAPVRSSGGTTPAMAPPGWSGQRGAAPRGPAAGCGPAYREEARPPRGATGLERRRRRLEPVEDPDEGGVALVRPVPVPGDEAASSDPGDARRVGFNGPSAWGQADRTVAVDRVEVLDVPASRVLSSPRPRPPWP